MRTKIVHLSQLVFFSIIMFGCSTEQPQIVPYVKVQINVNLSLPEFNTLNSINNAVKISSQGYNNNGVIIYRNSLDEYTAFDATCPQHIATKTAVVLNDSGSGGMATCHYCNTIYYLSGYGSPSKGYPLQRYNVTLSGNYLYIYN